MVSGKGSLESKIREVHRTVSQIYISSYVDEARDDDKGKLLPFFAYIQEYSRARDANMTS